MRSRIIVGTCAWLVGAIAATAGSLYTVNQLGEGLLAQRSNEVTVAMVNAELVLERSERVTPAPSPTHSPPATRSGTKTPDHEKSSQPKPTASTSGGQLLTSQDGTVVAQCGQAGAYLLYWSPQPGYEAENVRRGPGPVASLVFSGSSGGIVVQVSCNDGAPVQHVHAVQSDDGSGHDS